MNTRDLRNLTPGDLRNYLGDRYCRKLANNTWLEDNGNGGLLVRLHNTVILTFPAHPSDIFSVNSGGYRSTTTKQRLNALLPGGYGVYQKNFEWFMVTPNGEEPFQDHATYNM